MSSTSFMTGVIAIIIGAIAFAFGMTSLVLVLLLRSTVNAQLGKKKMFRISQKLFHRDERNIIQEIFF